jgi:hypothetical protein
VKHHCNKSVKRGDYRHDSVMRVTIECYSSEARPQYSIRGKGACVIPTT